MAFTPNPSLFNDAVRGGLQNGKSLLQMIDARREKSQLQQLSEIAPGGDFNAISSQLFKMGKINSGLEALNTPYARQLDTIGQQFDQSKLAALNEHRGLQRQLGRDRLNQTQANSDRTHGFNVQKFNALQNSPSKQTDEYGLPVNSAMSQKMKLLLRQGVDEEKAFGIVSGRLSRTTNPLTGDVSVADLASGTLTPFSGQGFEEPTDAPQIGAQSGQSNPAPQTQVSGNLLDLTNDATGVSSSIRNGLSNTLGQIPGPIGDAAFDEKSVSAKNEFDLFKRELILSLSVNPKFPVAEQKRIENLLPTGVFTNPRSLGIALKNLDAELARIEIDLVKGVRSRNTTLKQRSIDQQTLRGVQAARDRIGSTAPGNVDELKSKYGLE